MIGDVAACAFMKSPLLAVCDCRNCTTRSSEADIMRAEAGLVSSPSSRSSRKPKLVIFGVKTWTRSMSSGKMSMRDAESSRGLGGDKRRRLFMLLM